MVNIILIIACIIAIWSLSVFIGNLILRSDIPALNIIIMAISIGVIVTHYMGLW